MKAMNCLLCSVLLLALAAPAVAWMPSVTWSQVFDDEKRPLAMDASTDGQVALVGVDDRLYWLVEQVPGILDLERVTGTLIPNQWPTTEAACVGHDGEVVLVGSEAAGDDTRTIVWGTFSEGDWTQHVVQPAGWHSKTVVVKPSTDGVNYYSLAGTTNGPDLFDWSSAVRKHAPDGTILWDSELYDQMLYPSDLIPQPDGGCIIGGIAANFDGPYIAKYDSDGNEEWVFDGEAPGFADWQPIPRRPRMVQWDNGNIAYAIGDAIHDGEFVALVLLNSDGQLLNEALIPQPSEYGMYWGAVSDGMGNVVLSFTRTPILWMYTDVQMIAVDPLGDVAWTRRVSHPLYQQNDIAPQSIFSETLGLIQISGMTVWGVEGSLFAAHFNRLDPTLPDYTSGRILPEIADVGYYMGPDSLAADGDSFPYTYQWRNDGPAVQRDVWIQVQHLATGNTIEVNRILGMTLPSGLHTFELTQDVPAEAPGGDYTYTVFIGEYPWNVDIAQGLALHKEYGAVAGALDADGWDLAGDWENPVIEEPTDRPIPDDYTLTGVFPNPFNPTTSVEVFLPAAGELTVTVYDVQGRQVAELAHGSHAAGFHTMTFDGAKVSSGVYFVRATVPGELDQVRKAILMK